MSLTAKTEKDNFSRLGQGIVGTGNTMARDLLTSYISPTDLVARVLPSGRPPHTVWKRLNKEQQEHIRKAVVDGYAEFDISLVYVLLRNVCTNLNNPTKPNILAPTQGWGKDPTPTDITPSDDMERLRILRNAVYGHVSKASIPDTEYQIHWQELKDIASRMKIHLGKDYLKELQEAEIYNMTDADVKQMMQEINKGKDEVIQRVKKITKRHRKVTSETVQNQNREIKQHISEEGRKIIEHITGTVQDNKQSIEQLHIRLLEINDAMTKHIPLAPLEEDGDTMPVDLLYASVVITEDVKCPPGSTASSSQTKREVSTPADIFKRDGVKRIFLKGDAARGKTTYCLWLVRKWCDTKGRILYERQETVGAFDFVFLIQFRNVNPNRSNIMDMICYDIFGMDKGCHDAIRHVLSSGAHKSLIIMDGLDEWNPNEEARKNLTCKYMPIIEGLSSGVVCFFSMRTWLFPRISQMKGDKSIVLEIHGLNASAIENVIRNVLINHYGLGKETTEFREKYREILNAFEEEDLESFMKIPLLANICVQLCYEGGNIVKRLTTFYSRMLNMLIERAHLKHESTKHMSCQTTSVTFPKIFSTMKNVMNVSSVILDLGKIAYEGLMPGQTKMVFQESELRSEIGENELKFALNVGLISHNEARSLTTRNVTVTFFHKSFQEFLAAIFCVSKNDPDALYEVLSTIDIVIEWSEVVKFICGLSPTLGCMISQHIESLADRNVEIRKYRNSNQYAIIELYKSDYDWENDGKVPDECINVDLLFQIQACWFREILAAGMNSSKQLNFHVSDVVHFGELQKTDRWNLTDLLLRRSCFNNIKSLELVDEDRIPTSTLKCFLQGADSLVKLMFDPYKAATSLHSTYMKSLRVLHLSNFTIEETFFKKNAPLLTNMPSLQILEFSGVKFDDWNLDNTPLLTNLPLLHTLELSNVVFGNITLDNTPLLTNLPLLQTLTLSSVVFGNIILDNTPLLTYMPKLHTLDLNHIRTGNVRMKDTALLANLPNVERLDVNSFSIGTLELGNTPLLTNKTSNYNISENKLEQSSLLSNMPKVHKLFLVGFDFDEIRLVNAHLLTHMQTLHTLELERITIRNMSLENAPLITNLPSLHTLKLRNVEIGNMKLTNTSLMANLQMLHVLELYNVELGGLELNGNPLIKNMPKLDTLTIYRLCILDCVLHDPTLDNTAVLSGTPNLRSVDLKIIPFDMKPWLSPDMLNLEEIILEDVEFSLEGWKLFIDSLTRIHHNFNVRLKNVEKDVKTYIHQSPDFTISTVHIKYGGFYERRFSCRYIGRHVYFGLYIYIHPVHFSRHRGLFIGKAHSNIRGTALGKTRCKYGRNVDRYVGKCVNSFVGMIFYDLSIKRVWPINT